MLKLEYLNSIHDMPTKKGGRLAQNEKLQEIINEFMESGKSVAKINISGSEYKTVNTAYAGFRNAIKRSKRRCVVRKRGNNLYLIREDLEE